MPFDFSEPHSYTPEERALLQKAADAAKEMLADPNHPDWKVQKALEQPALDRLSDEFERNRALTNAVFNQMVLSAANRKK